MARLGTYDAILADIRLPDVPGYEAYRKLREAQPQARVILMTSYGYDPSAHARQGAPGRPAARPLQAFPRGPAPERADLHDDKGRGDRRQGDKESRELSRSPASD